MTGDAEAYVRPGMVLSSNSVWNTGCAVTGDAEVYVRPGMGP